VCELSPSTRLRGAQEGGPGSPVITISRRGGDDAALVLSRPSPEKSEGWGAHFLWVGEGRERQEQIPVDSDRPPRRTIFAQGRLSALPMSARLSMIAAGAGHGLHPDAAWNPS
jgi:hypothetical protein